MRESANGPVTLAIEEVLADVRTLFFSKFGLNGVYKLTLGAIASTNQEVSTNLSP